MRDVFFYINAAMQRTQCKSERKLCDMLGISNNSISAYRNRNVLPTDETMIKLAKLAGIDPRAALLDLNMWRSPEDVKPYYKKIAETITAAAIAVLIICSAQNANASVTNDKALTFDPVYIITSFKGAF